MTCESKKRRKGAAARRRGINRLTCKTRVFMLFHALAPVCSQILLKAKHDKDKREMDPSR